MIENLRYARYTSQCDFDNLQDCLRIKRIKKMSAINPIFPVVLCGGSGTRLWPLSRELYPKPFVTLSSGESLFMNTMERLRDIPGAGRQ